MSNKLRFSQKNYVSKVSEKSKKNITELVQKMSPSPAVDSDSLAKDWLDKRGKLFSGYVDGSYILGPRDVTESSDLHKVMDPISRNFLAYLFLASSDTVDFAAENSFAGFERWFTLKPQQRSKCLYSIGQNIEKHQQLFALVESLTTGKHLHKTKSVDVPNLIQGFYHNAGWILREEFKDWKPTGVVCVVAEEYNNPVLSVSWRVSSILSAGNSVLLLTDAKSCLSAFLLAELCSAAGLPNGVLNVLPVELKKLPRLPKVSKCIFTGSASRSNIFVEMSAKIGMPCEVLIPRRPTVIVYDCVDLHSAANGVLESLFFNDTRSECGGCKILVQESIMYKFLHVLDKRFSNILIGKNLSKTDFSCIVTEEQGKTLDFYIEEAKQQDAVVAFGPEIENAEYVYRRPVVLTGVQTISKIVHDEIGGPVVVVLPFRTVKESIAMINCNKRAPAVSIWTDKISVALEVAHKLKTGTIWLNSQNLFDASAAYSGVYTSGNSEEGGKGAFISHLCLHEPSFKPIEVQDETRNIEIYGSKVAVPADIKKESSSEIFEYKLLINGQLKSSGLKLCVDKDQNPHAYIPEGSRGDIQSAISAAATAQPKWEEMTSYKRGQILLTIAENLNKRKQEFVSELQVLTCNLVDACEDEVEKSLERLHYWALQIDKYCGKLEETVIYGKVLQDQKPLGIIGIQCPDTNPLLSFISLVAPAIAFGNAIVTIPSILYPTLALKMCEVFIISNVPAGVVNVISGDRDFLTRQLCTNMSIDAIWFGVSGRAFIYNSCSLSQKKVFFCDMTWSNLNEAKSLKLVMESTYRKTIYIPMGEIFAN